MGVLGLVFDVAYRSLLPILVRRDQLVEGNSKLEVSAAGSEIVGPAISGPLIHVFTAPVALIIDAATFAFSAIALGLIQTKEPDVPAERSALWREGYGRTRCCHEKPGAAAARSQHRHLPPFRGRLGRGLDPLHDAWT